MCFTGTPFYLRNKSLFLGISWLRFSNVAILGTPKIRIMTICGVNSFLKMLHFYPTPKNGWLKHDFLVTLNVLVGVHERVENLLNRIGVRDLSFCDSIFTIFKISENYDISKKNYFLIIYTTYYITYIYDILFFRTSSYMHTTFCWMIWEHPKTKRGVHIPPDFQCHAWHFSRKNPSIKWQT